MPSAEARRAWVLLGLAGLAYVILFAGLYPPTHAIEDEVGFLNQALVWSRGAISAEGLGLASLPDFVEARGRHVAWRNPGRSLFALPFILAGGYAWAFASGALIHLLTTGVAALTLRGLGRSPLWALAVLCHPTLALYSRTVMADGLGALGLACAAWALVSSRRPGLWAGLAVGAAAIARYQVGLVLPFLVLALWRAPWLEQRRREALSCLVAGSVIGLGLIAYNLFVLGHPLGLTQQGHFAARFLGPNLLHYAACLLLLWPGMLLLAPAWRGPRRLAFAALWAPLLGLMLAYYFVDRRPSRVETLVVGQRLIQPILPLLVVLYAATLEERLLPWLRARLPSALRLALGAMLALGLLGGTALLFTRHQRYLQELMRLRQVFEESVPQGSLVLANRGWSKLYEVPHPGLPEYRWRYYEHQGHLLAHDDAIAAEGERPWFLAHLARGGAEPPAPFAAYRARYADRELASSSPRLRLVALGAREARPVDDMRGRE